MSDPLLANGTEQFRDEERRHRNAAPIEHLADESAHEALYELIADEVAEQPAVEPEPVEEAA